MQEALMMVFELSINMLVPILLCTFFGVWLGEKTGINWLAVPFFFIGALAGYTSIFKRIRRFLKDDKSQNSKNPKKEEDIKEENHAKKN